MYMNMRQCETNKGKEKRKHILWSTAKSHAKAMQIITESPYTPYLCHMCGYLHVGRIYQRKIIDYPPPIPKKQRKKEEMLVGKLVHQLRNVLDKERL